MELMRLDKNSRGTMVLVYSIAAALILLICYTMESWWVKLPLFLFILSFSIWQTFFHLVPNRNRVGDSHNVSAVADGKIIIIEKKFEKEFLKCDCTMISIYMDFWDVHANFWPVDGKVEYYKYHPGKHFLAFLPKASEDNEHTCTSVVTEEGKHIFFKQIAGGFARRIVNYSTEGLETESGKQCGIIKFGSRIDMFFPLDAEIKVSLGDTVRACETIVAEI